MLLMKLSPSQMSAFGEKPEIAMGFQVGRIGEAAAMVLSGTVLFLPNAEQDEATARLAAELWFGSGAPRYRGDIDQQFDEALRSDSSEVELERKKEAALIDKLKEAPADLQSADPDDTQILGLILHPFGYLPPTPARPRYIYGHLPFTADVQPGDVFYRCEHWLTSRRVLIGTGRVLAGTYGFPASERPFVPTGFSAVGRYTLPDLPPACRRYRITPPTPYVVQCGACVPLYGQAGGGVEVMFPKTFANASKIPPPAILPAL